MVRNGSLYLDVGVASVGSGARVRYAWRASPGCVLANGAGIPMSTIDVPVGDSFVHNDSVSISDTSVTGPLHAPPLGSNSWNYYHCNIDENTVKAIADEYVRNGMRDAGYRYVNIDGAFYDSVLLTFLHASKILILIACLLFYYCEQIVGRSRGEQMVVLWRTPCAFRAA